MSIYELSDREAVLEAMAEFDSVGRDPFLAKYGFGRSTRYMLLHDGKEYDVKAIAGAAHGVQFPEQGPLKSADFTSGTGTTVPKMGSLGFEVKDLQSPTSPVPAYLFQANPKYFDIQGYLSSHSASSGAKTKWIVSQYENQIKAGNRAYIWQSGPGGGIVAVGTITSDPKMMEDAEGEQFVLTEDKFAGEQLRTIIEIGEVIEPSLRREDLKSHPILKDLGVIRFAPATNYKVTPEEDVALQELINDMGTSPLEELVSQWRKETGYPTDKAKQRISEREELAGPLTEGKLDEVIAEPERFAELNISRLAGQAAGGPGPMAILNKHLAKGIDVRLRLTEALRHLLYGEGDVASRLDDIIAKVDWGVPGFSENLAVKALSVVYPEGWLPVYGFTSNMGKSRLISLPDLGIEIPDSLDEMSPGARAKWSNDALREKTEPHIPGDPWGQMKFLYWLRDQAQSVDPSESLTVLADELLVDPVWLEEVRLLLEEKRQVIFQGPPGTGKTFVARELGRHFESLGGGMEIVQFHPSYAYEDFVEGYRPRLLEGQPGFELVAGPLMRLARQAEADSQHQYVLIIDELNRGNVAKVFGELYFLLEYRGEKIRLQYSEAGEDAEAEESRFGLPKNLWIIATTNTADRSIALMDAALRRRFYFVDYYPDRPPVEGLLERWLHRHGYTESFGWLVPVLAEANRLLDNPEAAIGPSHFLLRDPADLSMERIERIWNHAVIPYVQEQLVGEPERLTEFELPKLRKSVELADAGEDATGAVDEPSAADEGIHDETPTVDDQAE